jgi:hypothetical protein
MNLAFKLSGPDAIVFRKPWGAIAFSVFTAAICFAAGAGFSSVIFKEPKSLVAIPFAIGGAIFAICGLLILQHLLSNAGTWLRKGGVPLVQANKSGLTIATAYTAKPQSYAWSSISHIILADGLEIIASGDTNWANNQFIAVLTPDAPPKTIWSQVNAHIARSGEDNRYLTTDFPRSQSAEIERAIRRLAPASVLVRRCKQVTFDRKAKIDKFENA